MGGDDGPTKFLLEFMDKTKGEPPKDWPNARNIDQKEPEISPDFMNDFIEDNGEDNQDDGELSET